MGFSVLQAQDFKGDIWQGVYHANRSVGGLLQPPEVIIQRCQSRKCSFEYSYYGHHVCELRGSIRVLSTSKAEFSENGCKFSVVRNGTPTKSVKLERVSKECQDECGVQAAVVEYVFDLAKMDDFLPPWSCDATSSDDEKIICGDFKSSSLAKRLAELKKSISEFKDLQYETSKVGNFLPLRDRCKSQTDRIQCVRAEMLMRVEKFNQVLACLKHKPVDNEIPIKDMFSYEAMKRDLIKSEGSESAERFFKMLPQKELRQWMGQDLFDVLDRPNVWCDGLGVKAGKDGILFWRELCPSSVYALYVSSDGHFWSAESSAERILIGKPEKSTNELPSFLSNHIRSVVEVGSKRVSQEFIEKFPRVVNGSYVFSKDGPMFKEFRVLCSKLLSD
jgi:hypothetical protein